MRRAGSARGGTNDMGRYTLLLPGACCAVIGTGHIDRKDLSQDQMKAGGKIVLTIPARVPLTAWPTGEMLPEGPIGVEAVETI